MTCMPGGAILRCPYNVMFQPMSAPRDNVHVLCTLFCRSCFLQGRTQCSPGKTDDPIYQECRNCGSQQPGIHSGHIEEGKGSLRSMHIGVLTPSKFTVVDGAWHEAACVASLKLRPKAFLRHHDWCSRTEHGQPSTSVRCTAGGAARAMIRLEAAAPQVVRQAGRCCCSCR
jgi:hypothetical protein